MVEATPVYTRLPGMTPEQAATWVSRAVADRRRVMAPWYARVGALMGAVGGRPPDWLLGLVYRMSEDSAAARGGRRVLEKGGIR